MHYVFSKLLKITIEYMSESLGITIPKLKDNFYEFPFWSPETNNSLFGDNQWIEILPITEDSIDKIDYNFYSNNPYNQLMAENNLI